MPDGNRTDVLAAFFVSANQPIPGDCTSLIDTQDELQHGFRAEKCCELIDFSLGLHLQDHDESQGAEVPPTGGARPGAGGRGPAAPAAAPPTTARGVIGSTKFPNWCKARPADAEALLRSDSYVATMDDFEITRLMDRASPILFRHCCHSISLHSIALVKRVATGRANAMNGFLRLDFTDVLIVGMDWDNDDVIKEKCKFIFKSMTVMFRPQSAAGTMASGDGTMQAEWKQQQPRQGGAAP